MPIFYFDDSWSKCKRRKNTCLNSRSAMTWFIASSPFERDNTQTRMKQYKLLSHYHLCKSTHGLTPFESKIGPFALQNLAKLFPSRTRYRCQAERLEMVTVVRIRLATVLRLGWRMRIYHSLRAVLTLYSGAQKFCGGFGGHKCIPDDYSHGAMSLNAI